jgi:hypothetical protein
MVAADEGVAGNSIAAPDARKMRPRSRHDLLANDLLDHG